MVSRHAKGRRALTKAHSVCEVVNDHYAPARLVLCNEQYLSYSFPFARPTLYIDLFITKPFEETNFFKCSGIVFSLL